jgi:hypothetical protein
MSSKTALEEPFFPAAEGSKKRRDGNPRKATVEGRNRWSCTLVFLFSKTALEEPFTVAERTSEEA